MGFLMENVSNDVFSPNRTNVAYATPHVVETLLIVYYIAVVLVGFTGNVLIVISVVKYKHLKSVVNIFLANLAVADLLFVVLSFFDATQFLLDEWIFGDLICRVQGSAIEVSYTVSVVTLTIVSLERYLSICYPHRRKRTVKQSVYTSLLIWVFAVAFCGVLMHGYHGRHDDMDRFKCENDNWPNKSRLIFYIIHSVFVYLLPLSILCVTHYKISIVLEVQRRRTRERLNTRCKSNVEIEEPAIKVSSSESECTSKGCDGGGGSTPRVATSNCCKNNSMTNNYNQQSLKTLRALDRRSSIIRLLVVITTIFLLLWSPFIVVRVFKYAEFEFDDMYFRASQLLIFTNTAVNFFAYALMSTSFRRAFTGLFTCATGDTRICHNISRTKSIDIGESLRKSFSSIKAVPNKEEAKMNV